MASIAQGSRGPFRSERPRLEPSRSTRRDNALMPLGDLSDAISLVTVVHRSLATHETAGIGDEEVALRHALKLLRAAYSDLDSATGRPRRQTPSPTS